MKKNRMKQMINDSIYKQCCKMLAEDKSFKEILFNDDLKEENYILKDILNLKESNNINLDAIFKRAIDDYINIRLDINMDRMKYRYYFLNRVFTIGVLLKKSEIEIENDILYVMYKRIKK